MKFSHITSQIIRCAMRVHTFLGCGFLEKLYERALLIECRKAGLEIRSQCPIAIKYDDEIIGNHKLDLLVNDLVVVELKAVRAFENIHYAQLAHYLKATGKEVGLLLNFGKESLEIKRIVN